MLGSDGPVGVLQVVCINDVAAAEVLSSIGRLYDEQTYTSYKTYKNSQCYVSETIF